VGQDALETQIYNQSVRIIVCRWRPVW